jgi:hypothetical protein
MVRPAGFIRALNAAAWPLKNGTAEAPGVIEAAYARRRRENVFDRTELSSKIAQAVPLRLWTNVCLKSTEQLVVSQYRKCNHVNTGQRFPTILRCFRGRANSPGTSNAAGENLALRGERARFANGLLPKPYVGFSYLQIPSVDSTLSIAMLLPVVGLLVGGVAHDRSDWCKKHIAFALSRK